MPSLRLTVPIVLTVTLAACAADESGVPRAWRPLSLGVGEHCPEVHGRYFDSSGPIPWLLAGRFFSSESVGAEWAYFELAGSGDTAFTVTVAPMDGETRTRRLSKGTAYGGDYYCEDGWLKVSDRHIPDRWDDDMKSRSFVPRRHDVRMAPGANGALVARLDFIGYDELTVWCGDGCKGLPLPWTFETRSRWSAVDRWDPDAPSPPTRDEERRLAERHRAERDPLLRAQQLLEHGPALEGERAMRARATAALVPGVVLRGVDSRGAGWQLSVEFEATSQLDEFVNRLSQSISDAEVGIAALYRARMQNGHWIDVVYVRPAP